MRKIQFIFILCAFVMNTNAQTTKLCPQMDAFYEYCKDVRSAVQKKNISSLEKCIENWNGENLLKYKGEELELTDIDDIVPIDTIGKVDTKGHLLFTPMFVDSLVAYGTRLENFPDIAESMKDYTDTPDLVRGGTYDCAYTHIGIKAGKQVSMSFSACGECELFVMSENGAKITTSITLENEKKALLKETSDAPFFKWDMANGRYVVTIKNPSKKNISVIIASN